MLEKLPFRGRRYAFLRIRTSAITIYNSVKHNNTDFSNYVKEHILPRTFSIPALDGTTIKVEFAKDNDRIQKDGDESPRKVTGELTAANTTLKKIAILNIRDLIKNSEPLAHKSQNNHQWLDTNGWSDRKAYMRYADEKNGDKIYPVIIHIANARDGRHILYDVSVFEKEGSTVDTGASALASLSDDGTSSSRENESKLAVKSIEPSGEMVAQDAPVVKGNVQNTDGAKYSRSYDRPNFNKDEWSIVNRRKHSEFDNPKYDLDNDNKWMYANEKGYTVFAIYSKNDAEDPAVLYGASGKKAQRDYADLNDYFTGRRKNAKRSKTALDRLLGDLESKYGNGSNGVYSAERGQTATGDVPIPFDEPGSNGRRDLVNGTENFQETELTEYNDEASESPDASFVTFSNDYQAIRNFMKEGDTGESDVQYSISKDSGEDIPFGYKSAKELAHNKEDTFSSLIDYDSLMSEPVDEVVDKNAETVQNASNAEEDDEIPIKTMPSEIKTVQDRLDAKIANTQAELDKNREYREQSLKDYARDFGGTLSDPEVMTLCKISRNSYYKYKRELKTIA